MKTPLYLFLSLFAFAPFCPAEEEPERGSGPPLGHMVFFDLREDNKEAREKLVAGCLKHLGGHEGTIHFSVGTLAEDLQRELNDRDFDVALHLVFKDKAAHDKYQTHPRHLKFIEENKALWKKVRVFDSYLSAPPTKKKGELEEAREKVILPDAATSFAGMIKAKVVAKRKGGILARVEEIEKEWEHNKAKDSRSLVGKMVLVLPHEGDGEAQRSASRFLKLLQPGELVSLDVAHREGEALTLLELTEEQREKVEAKTDRDL